MLEHRLGRRRNDRLGCLCRKRSLSAPCKDENELIRSIKSTGRVSASAYTQDSQHTCIACPCFQQFTRFVRTESYGSLRVTSRGHAFYKSTATTASEHLRSQVDHFVCNILYISSGESHCQVEECIAYAYVRLVPTPSAQMRI